jgi:hypothetical protein
MAIDRAGESQAHEAYEPPVVEELDTTYDPAHTAAGVVLVTGSF